MASYQRNRVTGQKYSSPSPSAAGTRYRSASAEDDTEVIDLDAMSDPGERVELEDSLSKHLTRTTQHADDSTFVVKSESRTTRTSSPWAVPSNNTQHPIVIVLDESVTEIDPTTSPSLLQAGMDIDPPNSPPLLQNKINRDPLDPTSGAADQVLPLSSGSGSTIDQQLSGIKQHEKMNGGFKEKLRLAQLRTKQAMLSRTAQLPAQPYHLLPATEASSSRTTLSLLSKSLGLSDAMEIDGDTDLDIESEDDDGIGSDYNSDQEYRRLAKQ
jgi:hypothetical protein